MYDFSDKKVTGVNQESVWRTCSKRMWDRLHQQSRSIASSADAWEEKNVRPTIAYPKHEVDRLLPYCHVSQ